MNHLSIRWTYNIPIMQWLWIVMLFASHYIRVVCIASQIAKLMGPTWGPPRSCRPQMGSMLALWTLLSGLSWNTYIIKQYLSEYLYCRLFHGHDRWISHLSIFMLGCHHMVSVVIRYACVGESIFTPFNLSNRITGKREEDIGVV